MHKFSDKLTKLALDLFLSPRVIRMKGRLEGKMGKKVGVEWVKALCSGDVRAFMYIYQFYKNSLYYFVIKMVGSKADTDDILQEVFIKVYHRAGTIKNAESFHGWIFAITYNETRRYMSKKKYTVAVKEDFNIENEVISREDPIDDVNNSEVYGAVSNAIHKLSPKYKETATLRYLEGLSIKEIAMELDISEGLVKSRLYNARSVIKPMLSKAGYEPIGYE